MADKYDNNMSGALFKNDKKTEDRHPDYTGQCEINGRQFRISSWLRVGKKSGQKFMSLAFTEMEERGTRQDRRSNPRQQSGDFPGQGGDDW